MATEVGKGIVPVTFDKAQIGRDLSSSIDEGARQSEGHIGSTFKRLAGLAAGAFAVAGVGSFVKDSIDAARESNKIAAQTEAVIKSTGGAANATAKDFSDLATAISLKTGIDDESIQKGENLLATFTNIRNEVGKGNDIFNQATKIAVDMGAALGGDASSNAIQLGKALNDPIKGLTALTRVGVTFSDEQRAQIKTMQEHGDIVGAQKVLLAELNKEFGGSAEATATAGAKWGVFWGNLQEKFGNLLIPVLDAVAEWAMTTLPDAFGVLQDIVEPVLLAIGGGLADLWEGFSVGTDELGSAQSSWAQWGATAFEWFDKIQGVVAEFFSTLTTGFTNNDAATGAESFALILRNDLWPILQEIGGFVADNFVPILIGLGITVGLLTAPFTTVAVGLVVLYAKSAMFRDIVEKVREGLVSFGVWVMDVFHMLQDRLGPAFLSIGASLADLARFFAERWDKIRSSVVNVLNILKLAVGAFIAPIYLAWTYFHDQILAVVQVAWDQITTVFSTAFRVIGDVFDVIFSLLSGDWGGAWDAAKDIPAAFVDFVKGTLGNLLTFAVDFFSSLPGNILTALGDLLGVLVPAGMDLISGLLSGTKDAAVAVFDWYINLPATILSYFVGAIGWLHDNGVDILTGLANGIIDGFTTLTGWLTGLPGRILEAIGNLGSLLVGVGADLVGGFLSGIRDALLGAPLDGMIADAKKKAEAAFDAQNLVPPPIQYHSSGSGSNAHAGGGVFDRATFGWFGEAGREVILPLTNPGRTWELAGKSGLWDVLAKGMPRMEIPNVGSALGAGRGGRGNTYQMTSGPVFVNEPQDIETGMRRLELMAGVS